jgi:hypothetical protein
MAISSVEAFTMNGERPWELRLQTPEIVRVLVNPPIESSAAWLPFIQKNSQVDIAIWTMIASDAASEQIKMQTCCRPGPLIDHLSQLLKFHFHRTSFDFSRAFGTYRLATTVERSFQAFDRSAIAADNRSHEVPGPDRRLGDLHARRLQAAGCARFKPGRRTAGGCRPNWMSVGGEGGPICDTCGGPSQRKPQRRLGYSSQ